MRGLNEPFADWLARGEVTAEVARINGSGERTLLLIYVNVHIPSEVPVAAD